MGDGRATRGGWEKGHKKRGRDGKTAGDDDGEIEDKWVAAVAKRMYTSV